MGKDIAQGKAEAIITATVTRKDGTVEKLGVISRQKVEKSAIKRFFNKL